MKTSPLYRLEIAPLVILPLSKSPFFSYLSHEPVLPGSKVAISFGKRSLQGIVFSSDIFLGQAPSWMKYITKVIDPKALTSLQLSLALYITQEYFAPLGKTLLHFLPKQTSRKKKISSIVTPLKKISLKKQDDVLLKNLFLESSPMIRYVQTTATQDFDLWLLGLAKKILSRKKQLLIIVPELVLLPALEKLFTTYFHSENIALLESDISDGLYFEYWQKIQNGEAKIILSTRQGLFAPFLNLDAIVVLEEQEESYKQWNMTPRYEAKNIAEELALLSGAKLILSSHLPSVESLYRIQKKECLPLCPLTTLPPILPLLQIVNLRLERFRKNYSPLSQELIYALTETLQKKEKALLFIHRQGLDAFSVCENCKTILRCPKSGHTLSSMKDGRFQCLHCRYMTDTFPSCPTCGHLVFRHIGFGTEKVEKEIKKMFPGARILRADGSTMRTKKDRQKFFESTSLGNVDILIGTQMILKRHTLPKLSFIGMIDADSLLSFPDFRADEKLFHVLTRFVEIQGHSIHSCANPRIIVQTFHPENSFFQKISEKKSDIFLQYLLDEREDLFYPPFSRLITLIFQDKNETTVLSHLKSTEEKIRTLLKDTDIPYRMSTVPQTKQQKKKDMFVAKIVLRIPRRKKLPEQLSSFFKKQSSLFTLDIDSLSFF